MMMLVKALIGLATLAFLLAVYVGLGGSLFDLNGEAFSRASGNLALIGIGLALLDRKS
jgi:hypothetical protein